MKQLHTPGPVKALCLRLPTDLADALTEAAHQQGKSVNHLLYTIVATWAVDCPGCPLAKEEIVFGKREVHSL